MLSLSELQTIFLKSSVQRDESAAAELIRFIRATANKTPAERLAIYRSNIQETHINALQDIYAVCKKLVGNNYFRQLAGLYVSLYPSKDHDLNRYGEKFPDFLDEIITTRPEASSLCYLSDIARLEWLYHKSHYTIDESPFDVSLLSEMPQQQWIDLQFRTSASLGLLCSGYPVFEIWCYHQGKMDSVLALEESAELQHIAVWRKKLEFKIEVISALAYGWLIALGDGANLGELSANLNSSEELGSLLSISIQRGWIVGLVSS